MAKPTNTILVLNSASFNITGAEPPTEIQLFKFGNIGSYHIGGTEEELNFTKEQADMIVNFFNDKGVDLMIDYEHASLSGKEKKKPAAGWIKGLEVRADGLYASPVEWTAKAKQMLMDKEYRYFSPAYETVEGEIFNLLPVALTNLPATKKIKALMNSAVKKDNKMADNELKVETLSAVEANSLKAEIEALKAEKQEMLINAALDKAQTEGKLPPAKRQEFYAIAKQSGVAALNSMFSVMSAVVSTKVVEKADDTSDKVEVKEPTEFVKTICAANGYDLNTFWEKCQKDQKTFAVQRKTADSEKRVGIRVDNTKAKALAQSLTYIVATKE